MIINKDCHLIDGAKNSAIYDLKNDKVYSINQDARTIIQKAIEAKELKDNEIQFINELQSKGLFDKYNIKKDDDLKVQPKPRLNFAWLELTENCNLNCVHCYGKFGKPTNLENNLKINDWKKVVDYLISIDCKSIQLIGGEPLAFRDFSEILEYIYNKGIKRITVFTNATMIQDKHIELFKKYNVLVRISLYSSNKEIHDRVTQVNGSFDKTISLIKLLNSNGVKVSIAIIAMKENESTLHEMKDFLNNLGLEYNRYDVIRPGAIEEVKEHGVSKLEILEKVYSTKPEFYITKEQFYNNKIWNPCWYGKIAITANGDIIPCVFSRKYLIGNIKKDSLEELKKNTLKSWIITKDYIKVCKDCEFRYACHDCRPLAMGINNDMYSKNPRCCYDPYEGEWKKVREITKELAK